MTDRFPDRVPESRNVPEVELSKTVVTQPVAHPVTQPVSRPVAQPGTHPASQPVAHPTPGHPVKAIPAGTVNPAVVGTPVANVSGSPVLERPVKAFRAGQPAFPYTVTVPAKNGESFTVTFVHEDSEFPMSNEHPHGSAAFTPAKGYRVGTVNGKVA